MLKNALSLYKQSQSMVQHLEINPSGLNMIRRCWGVSLLLSLSTFLYCSIWRNSS